MKDINSEPSVFKPTSWSLGVSQVGRVQLEDFTSLPASERSPIDLDRNSGRRQAVQLGPVWEFMQAIVIATSHLDCGSETTDIISPQGESCRAPDETKLDCPRSWYLYLQALGKHAYPFHPTTLSRCLHSLTCFILQFIHILEQASIHSLVATKHTPAPQATRTSDTN